jgi:hypothetical protein
MLAKYEGVGKPFERADWDQLLGHCRAVTDTPSTPFFYRELVEAYPEAKVILTIRDSPQQWWDSMTQTIMPDVFDARYSLSKTWSNWLWRKFLPAETPVDRLQQLMLKHGDWYRYLEEDMRTGSREGIQWYEDFIEEVKRSVPKDSLLIMNVKEGWDPLCQHLGQPVPMQAFPRANDRAFWRENMNTLNKMINTIVALNAAKILGPVLVGFAAVGLYWHFRVR